MTKFIFVTGGVVSGLGKGITAASIGHILKEMQLKVFMQKFDPYLNIDPGTLNPREHGEVFVTADGSETDLDLGHYERFIDEDLKHYSSITAGKIYSEVIKKERRGEYGGKTVQVIPHLTDVIKGKIYSLAKATKSDIIISEIGGTIGDIESLPFIEAIRQIRLEKGKENVLFIHLALIPFINVSKEFKTKPVQHSVKQLLSLGIQPDIIVGRSNKPFSKNVIEKISLFCNVSQNAVINAYDVENIYKIPSILFNQNIHKIIADQLKIDLKNNKLEKWQSLLQKIANSKNNLIKIHLVGKYNELPDAYLSVLESLKLAGYENQTEVKVEWIDAKNITKENYEEIFKDSKGILVPGGFGFNGIEGKILAANYARINKVPYLGICLGMQVALIDYARNVCKIEDSHSEEINPNCANKILHLLQNKCKRLNLGGTLRLGNYLVILQKDTKVYELYKNKDKVLERHRHRFEFNNKFLDLFKKNGMVFSGMCSKKNLVEIIELDSKQHPFFVASQYHPEFTSRPTKPNPLFLGFIEAVIKNS